MSEEKTEHFKTAHGSIVKLSGKHRGKSVVDFDWFEEPEACIECCVAPYPEDIDGKLFLTWCCEECDGGQAELIPINETEYDES
jgi:hypothetical protein